MFDIPLRSLKDRPFKPLVPLIPSFITPDHITTLAFLSGLLSCFFAATTTYAHLAVLPWLTNRFLDCLDGVLARHRNVATELGGLYDLMSDFIIYSIIPIAVGYGQTDSLLENHYLTAPGLCPPTVSIAIRWLSIAFLEATFHINNFLLFYCAAISAQKQQDELTSVSMKPALIEGFESGLIFTAMFVWPQYITAMCWTMGVLVLVGTVQRFWHVAQVLSLPRMNGKVG